MCLKCLYSCLKYITVKLQKYFQIESNSLYHSYNTRGRRKLRTPRFQREVMKQSIRVKGVYYWNYVSSNLTPDCSLLSFKSNLRRFLQGNSKITDLIPWFYCWLVYWLLLCVFCINSFTDSYTCSLDLSDSFSVKVSIHLKFQTQFSYLFIF